MGVRVSALPTDDRHRAKRARRPSLTAGVTATGKAQSEPAQHAATQRSHLLSVSCGLLRAQFLSSLPLFSLVMPDRHQETLSFLFLSLF